jgi:hypothetical protein
VEGFERGRGNHTIPRVLKSLTDENHRPLLFDVSRWALTTQLAMEE